MTPKTITIHLLNGYIKLFNKNLIPKVLINLIGLYYERREYIVKTNKSIMYPNYLINIEQYDNRFLYKTSKRKSNTFNTTNKIKELPNTKEIKFSALFVFRKEIYSSNAWNLNLYIKHYPIFFHETSTSLNVTIHLLKFDDFPDQKQLNLIRYCSIIKKSLIYWKISNDCINQCGYNIGTDITTKYYQNNIISIDFDKDNSCATCTLKNKFTIKNSFCVSSVRNILTGEAKQAKSYFLVFYYCGIREKRKKITYLQHDELNLNNNLPQLKILNEGEYLFYKRNK